MKLKQVVFVLVGCALLGLLMAGATAPAQAQTTCYNYSSSDSRWTLVAGVNAGSEIHSPLNGTNAERNIIVEFSTGGANYTFNNAVYEHKVTGDPNWRIRQIRYYRDGTEVATHDAFSGAAAAHDWQWRGGNWEVLADTIRFEITYLQNGIFNVYHRSYQVCTTSPLPSASPTPTATPTSLPSVSNDWARPVTIYNRPDDPPIRNVKPAFEPLRESGDPDLDTDSTIVYSEAVGADVHAVQAGTVTSVSRLQPEDCSEQRRPGYSTYRDSQDIDIGATFGFDGLGVGVTRTIEGYPSGTCYHGSWSGTAGTYDMINFQEYLSYYQAWAVVVELADGREIRYVMGVPRVDVGQSVSKGCVLGRTLPRVPEYQLQGETRQPLEIEGGYVLIQGRSTSGTVFNVLPNLTEEPQPVSCGTDPKSSTCRLINNPTFESLSGWTAEPLGSTSRGAPLNPAGGTGVTLSQGRVYQERINLDPTAQYVITVFFRLREPAQHTRPVSFIVQLGSSPATTIEVDRTTDGTQTYQSEPASYTPTSSPGDANYYDLLLASTDNSYLIIDYVCVADSEEGEVAPPGNCLLIDPELDLIRESPWSRIANEDSQLPDWRSSGRVIVPVGASISQVLKLYPKDGGPQTYTLTIEARPNTILEWAVNVDWTWGSASGTIAGFDSGSMETLTDEIVVSTVASNTLILEISSDEPAQALELEKVCITTADGDDPPGYRAVPIVLSPSCKSCAYTPRNDLLLDFNEFVSWIGCFLSQLWFCQARVILYGLWTTAVNILTFLGFLRLWLLISMQQGVNWMSGALLISLSYFNGQFVNLGRTFTNALNGANISTIVYQDGASLGDIILEFIRGLRDLTQLPGQIVTAVRDIAVGLFDLLSTAIGGLSTVLMQLIALTSTIFSTLAFMVQQFVANIVGVLAALIVGLLNGFNIGSSSQIAPGWIPDCSNPQSSLFVVCVGLALIEGEIAAGPAAIMVPVLLGLVALNTILWAIAKLSSAATGGDKDE